MDNTSTHNSTKITISIIVVAIIVIGLIYFGRTAPSGSSISLETTASSTMATATSTPFVVSGSSTPALPSLSAPQASPSAPTAATSASISPIAYSVITSTTTYSQNAIIPMFMVISNNGSATTTFDFSDGCQILYMIDGFNLSDHIVCRPGPTSFSLPPHSSVKGEVDHYPSVFKIPPGTYDMVVSLVGYDSVSVPITITQ